MNDRFSAWLVTVFWDEYGPSPPASSALKGEQKPLRIGYGPSPPASSALKGEQKPLRIGLKVPENDPTWEERVRALAQMIRRKQMVAGNSWLPHVVVEIKKSLGATEYVMHVQAGLHRVGGRVEVI